MTPEIKFKLKYSISDDEVVIYSSRVLTMFGVAFGIIYVASIAAILLMSWSIGGDLKIENILLCLILFVPFLLIFLFGNRQVIFSRRDEMVYKSYGFGRKELVCFSDVQNVQYVPGSTPSYRIYLKTDPYGKGINVLSPAKAVEEFDANIMPALEKMLHLSASAPAELPINLDNLQYYTRKGDIFTLIRRNEIGTNIFLFCLVAVFLYFGIRSGNSMLIFCVTPPLLIAVGLLTHTRKFDTQSRIFTHSIAFVWKKTYRFEQFDRFLVVRNTTNGMYDGTDVKLVFRNDKGNEDPVKLLNIRKTKKIEQFMQETKKIIAM